MAILSWLAKAERKFKPKKLRKSGAGYEGLTSYAADDQIVVRPRTTIVDYDSF